MKINYTYIKNIIIFILINIGIMLFVCNTVTVQAAEYDTDLKTIQFHDHTGMLARAYINGQWEYIYCIQKGYPFRSYVSELQMVDADDYNGTIAENLRILLSQFNESDYSTTYFRAWGLWDLNGDHTDASVFVSDDGAPSSEKWQEAFTEFREDNEDDKVESKFEGLSDGTYIYNWYLQIGQWLTGHEGSLPARVAKYKTRVKEISWLEAGVNMSQVYAFGMTHYYCQEDSDAKNEFSEEVRYQCKQAMDWAIEFNHIRTMGLMGSNLRLIYEPTCDAYIKTIIDPTEQYAAVKLYRQVVWKTTNMRAIPSFSAELKDLSSLEPIKLYWDEDIKKYTTTVSDGNGVLNYFDFTSSDVNITNNGDGTLTITSDNEINGDLIIGSTASKLEPPNGEFKLPIFLRWSLEGKHITFKYTAIKKDVENNSFKKQECEASRESLDESDMIYDFVYKHSHDYVPACHWYCDRLSLTDANVTHCNHSYNNCGKEPNNCDGEYNNCSHSCNSDCAGGDLTCTNTDAAHTHTDDCYSAKYCSHSHTKESCHSHSKESDNCHSHAKESDKCHKHESVKDTGCYHRDTCPYNYGHGGLNHWNGQPNKTEPDACKVEWACAKQHVIKEEKTIGGTFIDWQDLIEYATGKKLIDPTFAYFKVTTVPHEFPAQTDTEILLIADNDEWNDLTYTLPNGKTVSHSSHLRVGEKFHLKYIYSYEGASKGFKIESSLENKPYYQYYYLTRMYTPNNNIPIYKLRPGEIPNLSKDVPHAKLIQDLTDIRIYGTYKTPETAYTLNGVYSWNSGTDWNDKVYLDALTDDQFDDNYNNKAADDYPGANGGERITTHVNNPSLLTDFTVSKVNNKIQVVWEFDTEPEVFSSALVFATSYINVDGDKNYTKNFYDEAYNYSKDKMWNYNTGILGDHNDVGGVGYFSSEYLDANGTQADKLIPSHTIFTQNNEYRTYAVRNKVWQSNINILVSNFVQNTGAGITEHTYQDRERSNHDMNYNLYYTIDVVNPSATIFADKIRAYDNTTDSDTTTTPYDTSSDVYEFDVNTKIIWGSTGASVTGASYGNTTVVDHIKTGTTYIQREIPTVLNTMISQPVAQMRFSIYPNHDRLIYEDYYSGASVSGSEISRIVSVTAKDSYYPSNEQSASSNIYSAMNPNNTDMQPQNINNSNNVPDKDHQASNVLQHMSPTTRFNIKLSDGTTRTVVDSHTKTYTQYNFEYNPSNRNNKVVFPGYRTSTMFFKYSKTNYDYNGSVSSAIGEFRNNSKTQTESYYISQVLFKSNYTSKYMKELESQGAEYIKDVDSNGNMTAAWIDMVNQNKFAIVSAGQGFELRVTVKYENSLLTQYLARYFNTDDAQSDSIGTSNRVRKSYNEVTANSRQFCNISSLTGKDGRGTPYYKNTARAYISSVSKLDQLAVNLVTGSNVFKDLYVFMSDNDTVYSYSGIYNTPVIYERDIKYNEDFSVTTITYSMCVSHENGVSSNLQTMKFYTNQLAPDKRTPGIVEGSYDVSSHGEHSITIWTPVIAATPFDYPNSIQERYLGDAIELGYTIKTTGADDSIVHIVQ